MTKQTRNTNATVVGKPCFMVPIYADEYSEFNLTSETTIKDARRAVRESLELAPHVVTGRGRVSNPLSNTALSRDLKNADDATRKKILSLLKK